MPPVPVLALDAVLIPPEPVVAPTPVLAADPSVVVPSVEVLPPEPLVVPPTLAVATALPVTLVIEPEAELIVLVAFGPAALSQGPLPLHGPVFVSGWLEPHASAQLPTMKMNRMTTRSDTG